MLVMHGCGYLCMHIALICIYLRARPRKKNARREGSLLMFKTQSQHLPREPEIEVLPQPPDEIRICISLTSKPVL